MNNNIKIKKIVNINKIKKNLKMNINMNKIKCKKINNMNNL